MTLVELYRASAHAAHRRARAILGSDDEAWDVVQEVFAKVAEIGAENIPGKPMAYVYRATTNGCLNVLGARRVREALPPGREEVETIPRSDARDLLEKLWPQLDSIDRQIVILQWHDELPQEQIADVLGIWRRTVGRRLKRLRELAVALCDEKAAGS